MMIKLKYLHMYRDQQGRFRAYVRRKGQRQVPIHGKIGSPRFMAAYRQAINGKFPLPPPKLRGEPAYRSGPHIYFVRGQGHFKIGTTKQVARRLEEIQASSPVVLIVALVIPGDASIERKIHARFAHLRRHGEWFRAAPELVRFVADLRRDQEQGVDNEFVFIASASEKA